MSILGVGALWKLKEVLCYIIYIKCVWAVIDQYKFKLYFPKSIVKLSLSAWSLWVEGSLGTQVCKEQNQDGAFTCVFPVPTHHPRQLYPSTLSQVLPGKKVVVHLSSDREPQTSSYSTAELLWETQSHCRCLTVWFGEVWEMTSNTSPLCTCKINA